MVSDHAEFMGVFNQMTNPDSPLSKTELAKNVTSPDANVRIQTFAKLLRDMSDGKHERFHVATQVKYKVINRQAAEEIVEPRPFKDDGKAVNISIAVLGALLVLVLFALTFRPAPMSSSTAGRG